VGQSDRGPWLKTTDGRAGRRCPASPCVCRGSGLAAGASSLPSDAKRQREAYPLARAGPGRWRSRFIRESHREVAIGAGFVWCDRLHPRSPGLWRSSCGLRARSVEEPPGVHLHLPGSLARWRARSGDRRCAVPGAGDTAIRLCLSRVGIGIRRRGRGVYAAGVGCLAVDGCGCLARRGLYRRPRIRQPGPSATATSRVAGPTGPFHWAT